VSDVAIRVEAALAVARGGYEAFSKRGSASMPPQRTRSTRRRTEPEDVQVPDAHPGSETTAGPRRPCISRDRTALGAETQNSLVYFVAEGPRWVATPCPVLKQVLAARGGNLGAADLRHAGSRCTHHGVYGAEEAAFRTTPRWRVGSVEPNHRNLAQPRASELLCVAQGLAGYSHAGC
jgi:hypothetical protein